MNNRREGREAAVQYLFSCDLGGEFSREGLPDFWALRPGSGQVRKFAEPLIDGVMSNLTEIDPLIQRCIEHYEMKRLAAVDRNILRLAVYEMFHRTDIPPVVSINEAIELAKNLGGEESGRFVNGVLDRIKKELTRPLRTAS